MSKTTSKNSNKCLDPAIIAKFGKLELTELPDFHTLGKVIDKSLWVLWVWEKKLGFSRLSADEISSVMKYVLKDPISSTSITQAFNRSTSKFVLSEPENQIRCYSIMRKGEDHVLSLGMKGAVEVIFFRSGKKFSNKRDFANGVLIELKGDLSIVDGYFGVRTLDMLRNLDKRKIRFITKKANINPKEKATLPNDLKDFKMQNPNSEFRDYPMQDIHDRYILSADALVIVGHGLKDLGGKETFAIVLKKNDFQDTYNAVKEAFEEKWRNSNLL